MKCRFLHDEGDILCDAGASHYVPSVFETKEYCLVDRHRVCAFYCRAKDDGVFDPGIPDLQSRTAAP